MSWIGLHVADDRYRILALVRQGGMGRIYLAYDLETQREVVLKTPLVEFVGDAHIEGRFQREIHALAQFRHPHLPRLLDRGVHDGTTFAVLPYLAGGSLADRMRRSPERPVAEILIWLPQIASALDFLHERRSLHRDVRPDNILFDLAGRAFLIDYGLVKLPEDSALVSDAEPLSNSLTFVGAVEHMAPEVLTGSHYSPLADQYALGTTVYEALVGRPPFEAKHADSIVRLMKSSPVRSVRALRPDIPAKLDKALVRSLSMQPTDRFPSCMKFAEAALA